MLYNVSVYQDMPEGCAFLGAANGDSQQHTFAGFRPASCLPSVVLVDAVSA